MPAIIIPGRAARGQRPNGPHVFNRESPQFQGLVDGYWGEYSTRTSLRRGTIADSGGYDSHGMPFPDPVRGLFSFGTDAGGTGWEKEVDYGSGYPLFASSSGFTYALWLWDGTTNNNSGRKIAELNGAGDWSVQILIRSDLTPMSIDASIVTTSGGAAQYNLTGANTYAKLKWHHYALVWNPGVGLYQYVDGVLDTSITASNTTGLRGTSIWKLGTWNNVGFVGPMADLRWYSRPFTANEVWALNDPATRWDLYWVPGRRVFFDVGAATASGDIFNSTIFRSPIIRGAA